MYQTAKEADHAYYARHRDRIIKLEANRRKNRKNKAPERAEVVFDPGSHFTT
jgi:hypothetical protein